MILSLFVIALLIFLVFTGFPIFIALGICGFVGLFIAGGISILASLPMAMYSQIDNYILVAIPLYIFMGEVLAQSGLGKDLFETLSKWFNKIPGGLAVANIWACAVFGSVCGVSIAAIGAIGPFAVPTMLEKGYSARLASGTLAAAGGLATLIPPSIVMIVYSAVSGVSVAKLFIGGIIPGIVLGAMMSLYVIMLVKFKAKMAPVEDTHITWKERFRSLILFAPVVLLSVVILLSMYLGIATPTELGAFGTIGAIIISHFVYKTFGFQKLLKVAFNTTRATIAVMMIVGSSLCFANFLNYIRMPEEFTKFSLSLPLSPIGVVIFFQLLLVILGTLVDGISVIVVSAPILLPAVAAMGLDPLWFGIVVALNIEIAMISPPVGMNLYMMKAVVPQLSLADIIIGSAPFMIVEFLCMLLFIFVPTLALWLPHLMMG